MLPIAVAGHVCLDLRPGLGPHAQLVPGALIGVGPLAVSLGGSVANTGGALVGLGAEVRAAAAVGADELGEILVSKLAAEGFASSRLQASATAATSYSFVIERPGEDRTFWHHTGANDEFDGTDVELEGIGLLHLGYPPLLPGLLPESGRPLRELLARARRAGATTSLDLAVVDAGSPAGSHDWHALLTAALSDCDVVSPSLDDLTSALRIDRPYSPGLVDELAEWMLDAGAAVVAISAGRHGLRVRTSTAARLREAGAMFAGRAEAWAGRALTVPPLPITPRTTNGAGDASTAGLLFGIAAGAAPELAGALAAAGSAAVMTTGRVTPEAVTMLDPALAQLFAPGAVAA